MASKDANDTRRGERALTLLQQARVDERANGGKPKCGSPVIGSKEKGNPRYGKTCERPAGAGTDHIGYGTCSMHAGSMQPAKRAAAREHVADEVRKYRAFYGEKAAISFEEALLEEMQRTVGVVRWMEDRISAWGQDWEDLQWSPKQTNLPPLLEEHHGFRSISVSDSEFAAWLRHYQIERRHLASVAKAGIDSGIAKEIVLIMQRHVDAMNKIIVLTLKEFGVDDKDGRLPLILPRVIREVTGRVA